MNSVLALNHFVHRNYVIQPLVTHQAFHRPTVQEKPKADHMIGFLRDYGKTRLNSRLIDERRCIPPYVAMDLAREGFFGLQVPKEFGGCELSYKDTFRIIQQLTAIDANVMLLIGVHNYIGIPPIMNYGSYSMKETVLPLLAEGRTMATIAASEAGAGANFRGIETSVKKNADGTYTINGAKSWISLGSWANYVTVMGQLSTMEGKPLGTTAFLVEQGAPGFKLGPEALTLGVKGIPQNRLTLENVKGDLIGEEGQGGEVAQNAFTMGRMLLAVGGVGAMKRTIQIAARYAERRPIATGRLINNGLTLSHLEDMIAATSALETFTDMVARKLDAKEELDPAIPMVSKILGPELTFKVIDRSLQMLGARGFMDTNVVAQYFRDMRLCRIFEGPTETVAQFFGKRVFKDVVAFSGMLAGEFGAHEEATMLNDFVSNLRDEIISGRRWKDCVQPMRQWADTQIGTLAAWAYLSAVTKDGNGITHAWALSQLTGALEKTKKLVEGKKTSDKEALLARVDQFESSIGNIEQSLPGEEREIDEWVRV